MRILNIDDSQMQRVALVRFLQRHDHDVITATNGEEGISLLLGASYTFDVVLCDWQMAPMDGIAVFRRVDPSLHEDTVWIWNTDHPEDLAKKLEADHPDLHRRIGIDVHITPKLTSPELLDALLNEQVQAFRRKTGLELD